MPVAMLQELCQLGQDELVKMNYLAAAKWLAQAAKLARQQQDWDTLSRVYMPLQEARRQRRLRCGDGVSHLGLIAEQEDDQIDGRRIVENYPQGQLLVAGWGSIAAAKKVRELQKQYELYVETFLAAVYPTDQGRVVVIVPNAEASLPSAQVRPLEQLQSLLPPHCLIRMAADLPQLPRKANAQTFARTSAMWEELHRPYLATADGLPDTFNVQGRLAVPHLLGADVRYLLLQAGVRDNLPLGLLGTSSFYVNAGGFVGKQEGLTFIDYRHFSGNQTILAGSFRNFQLLDYYRFSTRSRYLEAHYDHHFNGFFFDKVPLLRRLKWQEVATLNYLTTPQAGHYLELGAGIEHILKVVRVDFYTALQSGQRLGTGVRVGVGF